MSTMNYWSTAGRKYKERLAVVDYLTTVKTIYGNVCSFPIMRERFRIIILTGLIHIKGRR